MSTRAEPRPARRRPVDRRDPRVPPRRPGPARAAGRRRLRILIVAGTVAVLLGAAWAVSVSPLLDIDQLQIRGLQHLTAAQIEQAGGTRSVEVTDHGVLLHLVTGPEIRMGEATRIGVKVRAALAVLGASQGTVVNYVDVSVPTNPVAG